MQQKRAENLTAFIHNLTKDFRQELHNQYLPVKQRYFHSLYHRLTQCYDQHITPAAAQQLDSSAMLEYFSCYKRTLKEAKINNKRLSEEALRIEVKMKQCIEIKSAVTKSLADFQQDRQQCIDDFKKSYHDLYSNPELHHLIEKEKIIT